MAGASRQGRASIDGIAERAVLRAEYVKGERKRLLTRAFMIRAIVLMTLMPDADAREVIIALAGDLALVPWARAWRPASPRAFGDWRNALGPEPLEELQDIVLRASQAEHEERDWRAVVIGRLQGVVRGRDADPGAGHAGEPGRVRVASAPGMTRRRSRS